ncbi:lysylphosphatidylglycerol synthase transmembrane domain-containing protein [Bianquea renquensis]|jgi:hypothetical protein|uniref:Phosphatidylglycerol lysyltransferase n=1 Tax=Bianquea renquensis TaxID=2763661 RepID=A0A926I070_9FIRM|nr:lysylphosphatidylglycerol synthase transmembrane domain-containing protein [Bianquea renquensis]MBC8542884.1 flippase-like domain-containing protein [Bianquea renquensis]
MSSFMEDKKKMWVSTLFLVALMAGTFFFLLRDISWSMLMDTLRKVNPIFIPLGFALMVCFVACEAINIRMILRQVGMRVPFFRCLRYSFVGFYFSSITPSASGGQPAQAYYMNKEGIPVSLSSLTLLVIVAIYQLVMMIYALVCFIWKFEFVSGGVQGIGFLVIFGFIFNSCLFFFIVATIFSKKWLRKGIMACAGFLHRVHILKDLAKVEKWLDRQIREYQEGAAFIRRNPKVLGKVLLVTVVQLSCQFLVPYCVYLAFGLRQYGPMDLIAVQALLNVAVVALPLPGAVGATEGSFLLVYKLFFSQTQILPAMLLSRGISFYGFVVISGIVSFAVHFQISRRQQREKKLKVCKESC